MSGSHLWQKIVGAAAAVLLAGLLVLTEIGDRMVSEAEAGGDREVISISFDPEVLEYDGTGALDLLEGVTAVGEDGTDLTDRVQAVLTPDGGNDEKKIRYAVFSEDGEETTRTRTLHLEGYTGPSLEVSDGLELSARDLEDLVEVLKERKELTADDGFSRDASGQVSWVRARLGEGIYAVTFTLRNDFYDEDTCTVEASISGDVSDIVLELTQTSVSIPAGSEFYPLEYVASAYDPDYGNIISNVQISGSVDVSWPGSYRLIYTLRSVDGTQQAEALLQVEVTEA